MKSIEMVDNIRQLKWIIPCPADTSSGLNDVIPGMVLGFSFPGWMAYKILKLSFSRNSKHLHVSYYYTTSHYD